MNAPAKKRQNFKYTVLSNDTWTDVTEAPASGEVIVVTDILASSNQGSSLQQFRMSDGSTDTPILTVATSSDRSEQIHFSAENPIHLKEGYRLQCSASANSYVSINYYVI